VRGFLYIYVSILPSIIILEPSSLIRSIMQGKQGPLDNQESEKQEKIVVFDSILHAERRRYYLFLSQSTTYLTQCLHPFNFTSFPTACFRPLCVDGWTASAPSVITACSFVMVACRRVISYHLRGQLIRSCSQCPSVEVKRIVLTPKLALKPIAALKTGLIPALHRKATISFNMERPTKGENDT